MRKFLAFGLLMALFIGTASAALFESGTKDAQPMVLYGKYNDTIVPIKAASDGSIGAQGEDSSVIFNVKTEYGAKGDGVHLYDGSVSSGQKSFTSPTASFTSSDVGKVISIRGAGGSTIDLTTTIASITSATAIQLTDNASSTVSGVDYVYGTDDTTAIQNAVTAVGESASRFGEVFFPAGIYIVNGAYTASNGSQIGLPTFTRDNAIEERIGAIVFNGPVVVPNTTAGLFVSDSGAVIYSTNTTAANGSKSIISGIGGSADPGNCDQIKVVVKNLTIRSVQNPVNSGLNFEKVLNAMIDNVNIDTAGINNTDHPKPTHSDSYAIIMPGNLAGTMSLIYKARIRGFYNGVLLYGHGTIRDALLFYHVYGICISGTGTNHLITIDNTTIERVNYPYLFQDGISKVDILTSIETTAAGVGNWSGVTTMIEDPNNYGRGLIRYTTVNTNNFSLNGGNYLSTFGNANGHIVLKSSDLNGLRIWNSTTASSATSGSEIDIASNADTAMATDGLLGTISYQGTTDASRTLYAGAEIKAKSSETWSASAGGAYMYFSTTPNGSHTKAVRMQIQPSGNIGIATTAPDKLLELNLGTSNAFRLTYNDANGSAANYTDMTVSSGGDLTIAPSGGDTNITGNIAATGSITSSGTSNIGWTVVTGADTACNTTCTSACVFGWNLTTGNITGTILACTDATADACLCAGGS